MSKRMLVFGSIVVMLAGACTSSAHPAARTTARQAPTPAVAVATTYAPPIDPAHFVSRIDNKYFPLLAGTKLVYDGIKDGEHQRDVVVATNETKVIDGVTCVAVSDVATHNGTLLEKTTDWYAQDDRGNVWYFGEDTAEYENGKLVTREGSWQAGVDGAEPGMIMPARPAVPTSYRQEYYAGHAEDMAWIVDVNGKVDVPAGSYGDVVVTIEWSRLEPKVIDEKFYAPGVGIVREVAASGPKETDELTTFTKGTG